MQAFFLARARLRRRMVLQVLRVEQHPAFAPKSGSVHVRSHMHCIDSCDTPLELPKELYAG
jgi:hypothetical protein